MSPPPVPPPTPPLRSLTCGPDPGNERRPRAFPQGPTGRLGPCGGGTGLGAGEGGGGALPPNGPRREAPNLYQRPLAHTNPDVAVGASRRHVRPSPAPTRLGPQRRSPGFQGAGYSGSCSSPRTLPAGSRGGQPKALKSRVWMLDRTFPFISTESFLSVIDTLLGRAVQARPHPPRVRSLVAWSDTQALGLPFLVLKPAQGLLPSEVMRARSSLPPAVCTRGGAGTRALQSKGLAAQSSGPRYLPAFPTRTPPASAFQLSHTFSARHATQRFSTIGLVTFGLDQTLLWGQSSALYAGRRHPRLPRRPMATPLRLSHT